jgi:hypothetical protein
LAKVDPFVAPIPRKFLNDPELRPFFEYLNRFLHDLVIRTGGGTDAIEANEEPVIATAFAQLKVLNERLGSGEFLTADTTGWTADTTIFWADETEA